MNKGLLTFCFLLCTAAVFGQSKSKVQLIKSSVSEVVKMPNGRSILKVRNGVFRQDFSTLTSDSALFYQDQNMVDAFGHVNINQGDTLNIFSDKLNYNGNTKTAILTEHVKMVDKDATLTTNYFTYNTATRIGTYTGGGKLVNKDNTLISKNGYYFASTRDEYFRYDVVCTTPDAVIKTDTLRYNSGSRIAYFYGPTNITGKDKDNLYTKNGTYNTVTEQAFFGKKNLYTQATKSLKGDSLFYDRLKGYGRATKNVTFSDSEQKMTLKGDLGEYFKADERAVITQGAYMIFVTEDTSAAAKPTDQELKTDSLTKNTKIPAVVKASLPGKQLTLQGITDSVTKKLPANMQALPVGTRQPTRGLTDSLIKKAQTAVKNATPAQRLTLKGITDSVTQRLPSAINTKGLPVKQQTITKAVSARLRDTSKLKDTLKALSKPRNVRYDSLFFGADTLTTKIVTYKALKEMQRLQFELSHRDTSIKVPKKKVSVVYKKSPKFLTLDAPQFNLITKTDFWDPYFFGKPTPPKPKPQPKVVPKVVKAAPKLSPQDSIKAKKIADSLALRAPKQLSDTSRVRIVIGHYHAKLFKADLQSKADSMFYSTSDSTIRCYTNPIIWTQGSQLSGDTINLQMKNKKLDNFDMFPAAFIVNVDKGDTVNFNQAAGRLMHGTFKNNKLNSIRITGNAETIFFKRDSATNKITEMNRTVSGIIQGRLNNGEISNLDLYQSTESKTTPIAKVKEDDKVLKGFLWKPRERPASKEAVTLAYKRAMNNRSSTGNKPPAKPGIKKPVTGKPQPGNALNKPPALKMVKDSLTKNSTAKNLPLKMAKDSIKKDTAKSLTPVKKP